MNEQTQKLINDSLAQLLDWAKQAGEFTKDQVPLVVNEIIKAGMIYHSVLIAVGLFLTIIGLIGTKFLKSVCEADKDDGMLAAFYLVSVIASLIVGLSMFFVNLYWLIFINLCPRLYVLEYLKELIK